MKHVDMSVPTNLKETRIIPVTEKAALEYRDLLRLLNVPLMHLTMLFSC